MCTRKNENKFKKCSIFECNYNGAYAGQRCHKHRLTKEELIILNEKKLNNNYDKCICLQCKKYFLKLKCIKKHSSTKGKYCSRECANIYRSKNVIFPQCQWCKKIFKSYVCKIKNNRGKYCSKKCMNLSQTIRYFGNKNPHWKGIKIHLNRIRKSKIGIAWKNSIKNRGSCELCKSTDNLQAHHKISLFSLFMTMTNGDLNCFYNPNDLFFHKEENGMLVCASCHEMIHPFIAVLKQRKK